MRTILLLAALTLTVLVAVVPAASAQPVPPQACGVVIDHSHPVTDPHAYLTCGPYWCIINPEVGIRCFG